MTRLLPVLLAALLTAPVLLPGTAAAAPPPSALPVTLPSAQATAEDDPPLSVNVTDLLPRAPTAPEQPVRIAGTITNQSDEAVEDVELRVLVDRVVRSRSALARADQARRPGRTPAGEPLVLADTLLRPGESAPFELTLTVADLRLRSIGVYPLTVQARGRVEDARRVAPLGQASTFIPWFDGPPQRTRVAWLWPLIDHPRVTPEGLLLNDDLADSLSTEAEGSGRLGRLLASTRAAPQVPVTYAVDPDLLATVATMTSPYLVRTGSGEAAERPASAAARAWLETLTTALATPPPESAPRAPRGLLALPYADPDILALSRTTSQLGEDVEQLRRLGADITQEVTGRDPDRAVAWPPSGRLTPAALDLALGGDTDAVVLDEAALEPLRFDANLTPSAGVELASASTGALTGLVVEQGLSALLQAGPQDEGWQGARLAEQRFLAETAMIVAESPATARTLLIAPDRRGDVVPSVATAALQDTRRVPWLCPVELAAVAAGTATCPEPVENEAPAELVDRGGLEIPAAQEPLLDPDYLAEIAEIRRAADQLTDQVLLPSSDEAVETKRRLLKARGRSESSAWRDRPRTGRLLTALLADDVEDLRDRISLRTAGRVALSGSTGTINVSIVNALEQPITVGVGLNDPVEARLTSTSTEIQQVGASESLLVPIQATTRTSGQFVVRATLLDRSGDPFGEPVELIVRSTGFSRAALAVTGLGAAVLLIAAGVRITRRALRRTPRHAG